MIFEIFANKNSSVDEYVKNLKEFSKTYAHIMTQKFEQNKRTQYLIETDLYDAKLISILIFELMHDFLLTDDTQHGVTTFTENISELLSMFIFDDKIDMMIKLKNEIMHTNKIMNTN